jgi:hypothetical protein
VPTLRLFCNQWPRALSYRWSSGVTNVLSAGTFNITQKQNKLTKFLYLMQHQFGSIIEPAYIFRLFSESRVLWDSWSPEWRRLGSKSMYLGRCPWQSQSNIYIWRVRTSRWQSSVLCSTRNRRSLLWSGFKRRKWWTVWGRGGSSVQIISNSQWSHAVLG